MGFGCAPAAPAPKVFQFSKHFHREVAKAAKKFKKPRKTASFRVFAVKTTFDFKRIETPFSGIVGITPPA
jgi:hypothetical protein